MSAEAAEHERSNDLRGREKDARSAAHEPSHHHEHRLTQASGQRDQGRPGNRGSARPQRNQNAGKARRDGAPAPPADMLAQKDRGERRDENRRGEIAGRRIRQRNVFDRGEEQHAVGDRQHHAQHLQSRPWHVAHGREIVPRQKRHQRRDGAEAANEEKLRRRIGRDHHLAEDIDQRKDRHRRQHEQDARQRGRQWLRAAQQLERGIHRHSGQRID